MSFLGEIKRMKKRLILYTCSALCLLLMAQLASAEPIFAKDVQLRARQGDAVAQFSLAEMCRKGTSGVTANMTTARTWYERSARAGYLPAQEQFARMLEKGTGGPVNKKQAIRYYELAAQQGSGKSALAAGRLLEKTNSTAQLELARQRYEDAIRMGNMEAVQALSKWYENRDAKRNSVLQQANAGSLNAQFRMGENYRLGRDGFPKDMVLAREAYERAARNGHTGAKTQLARLYEEGKGGPVRLAQARRWYAQAAQEGDATAQYFLGYFYDVGMGGLEVNPTEALSWYAKAAEKGNLQAQYRLALSYIYGAPERVDVSKAVTWLEKASQGGYARAIQDLNDFKKGILPIKNPTTPTAQYLLGMQYFTGGEKPKDPLKALYFFEKASVNGDARAQYALGHMYYTGRNVSKNAEKVRFWFEKSAIQGNEMGQYGMGTLYRYGQGVPQDTTLAISWLEKSALQGYMAAQADLGHMYLVGENIPPDFTRALHWLTEAGYQGEERAQLELAVMYQNGIGTPKSMQNAFVWSSLSELSGMHGATEIRKEARRYLTAAQYQKAVETCHDIAARYGWIYTDPDETEPIWNVF